MKVRDSSSSVFGRLRSLLGPKYSMWFLLLQQPSPTKIRCQAHASFGTSAFSISIRQQHRRRRRRQISNAAHRSSHHSFQHYNDAFNWENRQHYNPTLAAVSPSFSSHRYDHLDYRFESFQGQRRWRSTLSAGTGTGSSNADSDSVANREEHNSKLSENKEHVGPSNNVHKKQDQDVVISDNDTISTTSTTKKASTQQNQNQTKKPSPAGGDTYNNPFLFFPPFSSSGASSGNSGGDWGWNFDHRLLQHSQRPPQRFRRIAGDILLSIGFGTSSAMSLWSMMETKEYQLLQQNIQSLMDYLESSEINQEIQRVVVSNNTNDNHKSNNSNTRKPDSSSSYSSFNFNSNLLEQVVLLSRAQQYLLQRKKNQDPRYDYLLSNSDDDSDDQDATTRTDQSISDALRFAKYATAAYGDMAIQAAQLDLLGYIRDPLDGSRSSGSSAAGDQSTFLGDDNDNETPESLSKFRIAQHVHLPPQDIIATNVAYTTTVATDNNSEKRRHDNTVLRHFIALDHANRQVILSMRGTFSISELISDVVAFSRPFCGGQAHSEIANMAEKIWECCSSTIFDLLNENPGYELVLTGHSLGAGTAALLNIWLHDETNVKVQNIWKQISKENEAATVPPPRIKCYVFACPPVFAPFDAIPKEALNSCTNYIHGHDVIPFLSLDSVRQILHQIGQVRQRTDRLGPWWKRWFRKQQRSIRRRLFGDGSGLETTASNLNLYARAVENAAQQRLPPKDGAPVLFIPAAHSYWIQEENEDAWPTRPATANDNPDNNSMGNDSSVINRAWKSYSVKDCDSERLAFHGIQLHLKMLYDHFPQRYEYALHQLVVESGKKDDNGTTTQTGKSDEF